MAGKLIESTSSEMSPLAVERVAVVASAVSAWGAFSSRRERLTVSPASARPSLSSSLPTASASMESMGDTLGNQVSMTPWITGMSPVEKPIQLPRTMPSASSTTVWGIEPAPQAPNRLPQPISSGNEMPYCCQWLFR